MSLAEWMVSIAIALVFWVVAFSIIWIADWWRYRR